MSAWGAFIGLLVSIFLIIRKVSPVYSLILGALVGGLLGGVSLPETISLMISGVNDVTPAVIRILIGRTACVFCARFRYDVADGYWSVY